MRQLFAKTYLSIWNFETSKKTHHSWLGALSRKRKIYFATIAILSFYFVYLFFSKLTWRVASQFFSIHFFIWVDQSLGISTFKSDIEDSSLFRPKWLQLPDVWYIWTNEIYEWRPSAFNRVSSFLQSRNQRPQRSFFRSASDWLNPLNLLSFEGASAAESHRVGSIYSVSKARQHLDSLQSSPVDVIYIKYLDLSKDGARRHAPAISRQVQELF